MDYFSADLHLGHYATLNENNCNRPFKSLEEMDNTIIKNINDKIKFNDTFYILGDFSFRTSLNSIINYREMIKCKNLVLISGNHDLRYIKKDEFKDLFKRIETRIFYRGYGSQIILDHFALLSWPKSHYGSFHLFGHSHGNLNHPSPRAFDVGVDCWNFKPLSVLEVKEIFEKRINNE